MKEKFTPGPWTYTGHQVYRKGGTGTGTVAIIQCKEKRESTANGTLIAASPELYKILNTIRQLWDSIPDCTQVPDELNDDSLWDRVDSVLSKARGENQ